ncbi:MAG: hypothetical protein ACTHK7_01740 [Aureliella sp.]
MTRWLACLGLCCGLWVAVTATSAPGQRPGRVGNAPKLAKIEEPAASSARRDTAESRNLQLDTCQQIERPGSDEKKNDTDARRDGHRPGVHAGPPGHMERRFIFDAVRRTGGPLELLPLLHIPEVRSELQLDDQDFKNKLDTYMSEMGKRAEQSRKQASGDPAARAKQFNEHLEQENERFQQFLVDQLSESQRSELIYLFIQARNYRSLSNQLVQHKMGMSDQEASEIRQEIEEIREQTMDETRDRFRRIFDQGGGREQFEKMVRENQRKMDARIEKKLSESQREKFTELRSQTSAEAPDWLLHGIDFPFRPMPPRTTPRGQPTSKETP